MILSKSHPATVLASRRMVLQWKLLLTLDLESHSKRNNSLSIPKFQVSLGWIQEEGPNAPMPKTLGDIWVFEYYKDIRISGQWTVKFEMEVISPVLYKEGS